MTRIGNNRRFIHMLIFFSLIVISFFFVPMYTGALSTTFEARCDACHVIEHDEISRTLAHKTIKCTNCHNISEFGPDLYSHNATTYECIYCHTQQASQFDRDAHDNFSKASNSTDIFAGRVEMCVACHSGMELEIEWHSYTELKITSTASAKGGWTLDYSGYGDNFNTSYRNYTYSNKT